MLRNYSVQEKPSTNDAYPMNRLKWKCAFALFPRVSPTDSADEHFMVALLISHPLL